ncbi:hypothetical protein [uncultured Kriegella sp.]|uniref:hypothetical protein n=1 Tax=uncultured Kriegella sp. TaxID=1798910 RepID=UPI0030D9B4E1
MKRFPLNVVLLCVVGVLSISCSTPKYTYLFDTGKHLDFNEGKWILNKTTSNSKIFDTELKSAVRTHFKAIIGDSLLEINDLR